MASSDRTAALRARRAQEHSTPATRQPAPDHTTTRPADLVITTDMIPAPATVEASGALTHEEAHQLGVCERAVENLATATWLAGKALQSIRDRKLYRHTHTNFATYVQERWEISERTAYQMIEEWPLAERLNQLFGRPITASHTRALVQVSDLFGLDAAADLYQQLQARASEEDLRLTATIVSQITKAIIARTGRKAEVDDFREAAHEIVTSKALTLTTAPTQSQRALAVASENPTSPPTGTSAPTPEPEPEPTSLQNFADNHEAVTTPDHPTQHTTGPHLAFHAGPAPEPAGTQPADGIRVLALLEHIVALAAAIDKEAAPLEALATIDWAQPSDTRRAFDLRLEAIAELNSAILTLKRAAPFDQIR
jgi:hypothetical protein